MNTIPITLLHGFMGSPDDWDEVVPHLPAWTVCTPRIRPAADWDHGVRQLLQHLPERSIFVGYSLGARLLLACALAEPARCAGLVFVSGNPGLETSQERTRRLAGDLAIAHRIENTRRDEFLQWWYSESTVFKSLSPELRAAEIRRKLAHPDDWAAILRTYSVARQPNFWPGLAKLDQPVLAVAGHLDRKYANIIRRLGNHDHVEACVVEACGHIVHHEQPGAFLQLLRQYLQLHFAPS